MRLPGRLAPLITALILLQTAVGSGAAEEIDRLLAAVNGKVVTESDLRLARNLNALVGFGRTTPPTSRADEIDQLINRELLRQELQHFPLQPEDQARADQRLEELKGGYAEIGGITYIMQGLGLQEKEIEAYLSLQVAMIRFIDMRFRPFVSVTPAEVKEYYETQLVPRLRETGSRTPPLEEVSKQIEGILVDNKVGQMMDDWVQNLRQHSEIEIFDESRMNPQESAR
jgi:peptidyl-prolyl cis-trans isomerase SurA